MIKSLYSKEEFKKQPEDFRIGAIISDGMWYSFTKWQKYARVNEEVLQEWIDEHLKDGSIIKYSEDASSYRMDTEHVLQWYKDHDITPGDQIVDFVFPARIWDGQTETDGLIDAPLREIGMVTFTCSKEVAQRCIDRLKGMARVRQDSPNTYKAYCLDAQSVKRIVSDVFSSSRSADFEKVYSRNVSKRRELADLNPVFREGIVSFYKDFGKTLVKPAQETLKIFLPNPEDQEVQILIWVIMAIEKFDSSSPVPFSGYLSSVLTRWPYDLPDTFLGKELSAFQRKKSSAIKALKKKTGKEYFDSTTISQEMGLSMEDYLSLDNRNKLWAEINNATSITWSETGEEKSAYAPEFISDGHQPKTNIDQAHRLSKAIIKAAVDTENFEDALFLISKMDANNADLSYVNDLDKAFIASLGYHLGV